MAKKSLNIYNRITLKTRRLLISPVAKKDLRFLLRLWNDPGIMRYAGFARNWDYHRIKEWHERYLKRLEKLGPTEIQFIHRLKNGKSIGESRLGRLRSGWSCPNYQAPQNKLILMADVKLLKPYWNRGYGTEAMKAMVRFVFTQTKADLFLVPPHKDNIPAIRVYEKAGFKKTKGIWYRYHMVFKINKKDLNRSK
jgi:RimJ/RimL family protein N-acetyltransferase